MRLSVFFSVPFFSLLVSSFLFLSVVFSSFFPILFLSFSSFFFLSLSLYFPLFTQILFPFYFFSLLPFPSLSFLSFRFAFFLCHSLPLLSILFYLFVSISLTKFFFLRPITFFLIPLISFRSPSITTLCLVTEDLHASDPIPYLPNSPPRSPL